MNESQEKLDTLLDLLIELTSTGENSQLDDDGEERSNPHQFRSPTVSDSLISDREESKSFDLLDSIEHHTSNISQPEKITNNDSIASPEESKLSIDLYESIDSLEKKQVKLEQKIDESIDNVNTLLPFLKELMSIKNEEYRELVLEVATPIIDEIIEKKYLQDRQKMENFIAPVLPKAISQEIDDSPKEIAKALAPEIAYSIQEQIKIDRDSISRTLGPEMGKAIKTQIELEKDAMVDALYPVIGNTISKYMAEAVKSINDRVENALSLEGIKRKIKAKIKGVSEAELILAEAIDFEVKGVFLIAKDSGLIIEEAQSPNPPKLEAEMLGGMLTAIRSFVNDCIFEADENSELNEIEYSDSKILLEVAGYCYLAVIVKGEPPKKLVREIRETFSKIILNYSKEIENFDGDRSLIPAPVRSQLENLIQTPKNKQKSEFPGTFVLISAVLISAIVAPWGYFHWRNTVAKRIESSTSIELDSAPELLVYRLIPEVRDGTLIISGKVPNERLREQAGEIGRKIAIEENLTLDNQIVAVNVPVDLTVIKQEVETIASIFNFKSGFKISSQFDDRTGTVTLNGSVPDDLSIQQIISTYKQIPGVEVVVSNLEINSPTKIPSIGIRIYFRTNSSTIEDRDINGKIAPIKEVLGYNPELNLRIIGHSDGIGKISDDRELAIKRAIATGEALKELGVNPQRLHISGSSKPPPDLDPDAPLWMSRCVLFEAFIPANKD